MVEDAAAVRVAGHPQGHPSPRPVLHPVPHFAGTFPGGLDLLHARESQLRSPGQGGRDIGGPEGKDLAGVHGVEGEPCAVAWSHSDKTFFGVKPTLK